MAAEALAGSAFPIAACFAITQVYVRGQLKEGEERTLADMEVRGVGGWKGKQMGGK